MIKIINDGVYIRNGRDIIERPLASTLVGHDLKRETMAYKIMEAHNTSGNMDKLKIKFDSMASHDITYVGIVQTARASGLREFPLPYVLTNCHNSLCAVGGTINEDDHVFGLSAAQKYGGIYVPAHMAVIHQYMREMMSKCGAMILGSDSHTRYGALGTMAVGEGGPELVKQLLGKTYDIDMPGVVAVRLSGKPMPGVGPQDVALAIIGAVFAKGTVKNKVMEFIGDGIANLSAEYRIGIDVMTTETTCLSSIWATDDIIRDYYAVHGRPDDYQKLAPGETAYYNALIDVDLSKVEPMIALPFHPSNTYTIRALRDNLDDILAKVEAEGAAQLEGTGIRFTLRDKIVNGQLKVQQGVIAGCAGGMFENICESADIIGNSGLGCGEFALSVYPSSQPVNMALVRNGVLAQLMAAGATARTAFCGPCFGAGDVPANNTLSIRHTTRNFPNREGSKPSDGQITSVALMDARSIAATAMNGGVLTPATEVETTYLPRAYHFDDAPYKSRCYYGFGNPRPEDELRFGPNIADWPQMQPLADNLLLCVASVITDPVTTTDELIPSGETSSYRSNPLKLAEFTLSRKDPAYVQTAKDIQVLERARLENADAAALADTLALITAHVDASASLANTGIGSVVCALKPGDGSAREQAASCQKVLGTFANIAAEYATKRYRSNLINWGMLPLLSEKAGEFERGDYIFLPDIRTAVAQDKQSFTAHVIRGGKTWALTLSMAELTPDEREIILAGCLINYYRAEK